jgi:hypothetical protein
MQIAIGSVAPLEEGESIIGEMDEQCGVFATAPSSGWIFAAGEGLQTRARCLW